MSTIPNSVVPRRIQTIIDRVTHAFDLQRSGLHGKPVGDYISNLIVYGIMGQHSKGLEPSGRPLAPLSRKYLLWKIKNGLNPAILHKTDAMMEFRQLKGMVVVSKDAMTMWYGVDGACINKAYWTQEGQLSTRGVLHGLSGKGRVPRSGWVRPPREFYDINETSWEWIDSYLDAELDDQIMSLGARRI